MTFAFLDLLEVAFECRLAGDLHDGARLSLVEYLVLVVARLKLVVHLVLFHARVLAVSVDVVTQLDADLPLGRLVLDVGVFQQLFGAQTTHVVLQQARLDEAVELLRPLARLKSRRRVPRNQEQRSHRMHVAQRRLPLGHLDRRDPERPQIAAVVVGGVRLLVARDHLRCHPVRRPDERVALADRPIELRAHAKVNKFHFGVVRQ